MKKYSRAELEEMALYYFGFAHSTDMLLATEDGNFFYPDAKGSAQVHARRNGGLEIFEISRPKAEEKLADESDLVKSDLVDDQTEEPAEEKTTVAQEATEEAAPLKKATKTTAKKA